MLQGHAVQKFHGDEGLAVFVADVVNRADVGMIQCRRSLSLTLKTGQGLRIASDFFRQEFESDKTVKARVFGLVDNSHASAAEFLDDAVVRDDLADHGVCSADAALRSRFILETRCARVNEGADLSVASACRIIDAT